METIQELSLFNKACDEFVAGKYILVDVKINSILNIISEDEKIKDIINHCLQNYDFSSNYQKMAIMDGEHSTLSFPNNEKDIIAFVYNLLYKFKTNQIDFYEFLTYFFKEETDSNSDSFNKFTTAIIIPFKQALNSIYSKRHVIVASSEFQQNYYNKIKSTIKLIVNNIDNYKLNMNQKEEFTMLLNALYLASEKNDKKLVFSLMIGLDYFTKVNKKSRIAYLTLEECFEK